MINSVQAPWPSSRTMSRGLTQARRPHVSGQVTQTVLPTDALRVLDSAVHAAVVARVVTRGALGGGLLAREVHKRFTRVLRIHTAVCPVTRRFTPGRGA